MFPKAFCLLGGGHLVIAAREDESILERRMQLDRQRRNQLEELARVDPEHAAVLGFLSLIDRRMVHEQVRDVADGNTRDQRVDVLDPGQQGRSGPLCRATQACPTWFQS